MARRDLEELRAKISGLAESAGGGLSRKEKHALKFAGEDRLREIAGFFDAILDAQIEWEAQQDSGVDDEPIDDDDRERREILADYGYEGLEDYDDDGFAYGDDDAYWEVEAIFDSDS